MTDLPHPELAIFSAARRLPAGERAAYLTEACAGDAALRQGVEELLRASEEAGAFLQNRATPPNADALTCRDPAPLSEKVGDRIGRYKLLQQIGEGGCGVVYMAEQDQPVRRRVALKVIKVGMDTKQVIARFEAERQALALMDHPNIAKVLDAGATDTGRPYFVMELVKGIKITAYCDQANLSTRARLDLFIQVCQAVQHAHQKGVIHRDLKPSNILVTSRDGVAVPKVIDFGIAKATTDQPLTDKTLFTAFEQFMGTPAYMSPEQAEMSELGIDTRSDIYSLGVLLYELLTGRTPFDATELLRSGLDAMRRTIREEEPARPSTRLSTLMAGELTAVAKHRQTEAPKLIHLLRGDLDWIVMKSLEKDRARRYETANGLASDVQRHLNDEPVVACPPNNLYRLQKAVRRHKTAFGTAAAIAIVLVVGVVASTLEATRATRAEREQTRLLQIAQTKEEKSEQVAKFLKDMLNGVGPSVALGRDTKMLREIVDKTAERVGKDLLNQPEVEVELSLTLVETYHDLALYEQMEQLARHSLQLARERLGEENESVATSLTWLGDALRHLAQLRLGTLYFPSYAEFENQRHRHDPTLLEAEKQCRQGLAMHEKLLGKENPKVAWALNTLAGVLGTQRRMAEAETAQREALAMYQKVSGNEGPIVARLLAELAEFVAAQKNRVPEAEKMQREALAMHRKLLGDDHPEIAKSLEGLGSMLWSQRKSAEAETRCREALAMWSKLQVNDRLEVSGTLITLAQVLMERGRLAEAETNFQAALAMQRRLFGNEHAEVLMTLCILGPTLSGQNKMADAETVYREALALRRKLFGNEDGAVAIALNNLVAVLRGQGKQAEIEALCREELASAMTGFRGSAPGDPRRSGYAERLGDDQWRLAEALANAGRNDEAEKILREALQIFEKAVRDSPAEPFLRLELAARHYQLATALSKGGRVDEAEREHRTAIVLYTELKQAAPTNSYYWGAEASGFYTLGVMLESAGQLEAAVTEYRQAIGLLHEATTAFPKDVGLQSQFMQLLREKGKLAGVEVYRLRGELYRNGAEGGDPGPMNEAAWFFAACSDSKARDGEAAVRYALQAVDATMRQNPNYLDTLAAAYAQAGDFAEAVRIQEEAMALLGALDKKTAKSYESRLKLYDSGFAIPAKLK